MGTLTADCPRLAEHCPHKLPSSCRLTSTPNCCACADERQHSLTYRVYIDGVGFVQRGTRWQSYCWFCKSFWDARVAAAGLSPSETKIPEDPNQTEFVEKWFEFYQGYRIERLDDGSEKRVALEAEPLKDADPGHLPRTLEEIETGRRDVLQSDNVRRERPAANTDETPRVTLDEALDQLLEEADEEDDATPPSTSPIMSPALIARAHTNEPELTNTTRPTQEDRARLDEAYSEAQAAVEAAQRVRDRAEARLSNADAELAVVRERLRRIRRQQITAGNFVRVFGTREDVQSEDYVSPITSMFIRQAQWGRQMAERQRIIREQEDALRNFEDIQRQQQPEGNLAVPQSTLQSSSPEAQNVQEVPFRTRYIGDSHTFVHSPLPIGDSDQNTSTAQGAQLSAPDSSWDEYLSSLSNYIPPADLAGFRTVLSSAFPSPAEAIRAGFRSRVLEPQEPVFAGLDGDSRPEAKPEGAMQFKLECKICLQQVADTACLPCGHLSMCEWCADQWMPTKEHDKTRPRDKGMRCPCCRARVKSRVKIYVG